MARNFKELQAKMSPERRARSNARVQELITEIEAREKADAMGENFLNLFIYPCSQCNSAVFITSYSYARREREYFSGHHIDGTCRNCGREGLFLADDAKFQCIEWNLEIKPIK